MRLLQLGLIFSIIFYFMLCICINLEHSVSPFISHSYVIISTLNLPSFFPTDFHCYLDFISVLFMFPALLRTVLYLLISLYNLKMFHYSRAS